MKKEMVRVYEAELIKDLLTSMGFKHITPSLYTLGTPKVNTNSFNQNKGNTFVFIYPRDNTVKLPVISALYNRRDLKELETALSKVILFNQPDVYSSLELINQVIHPFVLRQEDVYNTTIKEDANGQLSLYLESKLDSYFYTGSLSVNVRSVKEFDKVVLKPSIASV